MFCRYMISYTMIKFVLQFAKVLNRFGENWNCIILKHYAQVGVSFV